MKKVNVNADFLLDIWADMKAKRLAPVALGLAGAILLMPVVLLKGEENAAEGPLPILASAASQKPEVEVVQELADRDSKLDSYKVRDPFKGRAKPQVDPTELGGAATAPNPDGGSDGKGAGDPLAGLGIGSSGGSGPVGDGNNQGPGSDPNFSPTPPSPTPPPVVRQRNYRYNYQLDLRFGRPGREQRYPAVTRLSFLPSPSIPALLFMGVPVDEKSALFFVHPGLTHQGEGSCVPSKKNCNFLQLEIGEEHYLSANDLEFRIELLDIKRVKLSEEKKERAKARKASNGRRSARSYADGAQPGTDVTAAEAVEDGLELPWLVDGIG
jgi:hypothetical protein